MSGRTVAQTMVEILVSAGVQRVYGVARDSLNGMADAIYDRSDIAWVPMRHEEAGAVRGRCRGAPHRPALRARRQLRSRARAPDQRPHMWAMGAWRCCSATCSRFDSSSCR
jgi:hypothetical protein